MFGWFKKKPQPPAYRPPDPSCAFRVACSSSLLPSLIQILHPKGLDGAVEGIAAPMPKDKPDEHFLIREMRDGDVRLAVAPDNTLVQLFGLGSQAVSVFPALEHPQTVWRHMGLNFELVQRARDARHAVLVSLHTPGPSLAASVAFATRIAARISDLGIGVAHDDAACRYFAGDSWKCPTPSGPSDPRDHVVLHSEVGAPTGHWIHTHGLVKFGRPEFEVYDVPEEISTAVSWEILNLCSYVIGGELVEPGHTVGHPDVPLAARIGSRNRPNHWEDTAVLELVDVGPDRLPLASGCERGWRAFLKMRQDARHPQSGS